MSRPMQKICCNCYISWKKQTNLYGIQDAHIQPTYLQDN